MGRETKGEGEGGGRTHARFGPGRARSDLARVSTTRAKGWISGVPRVGTVLRTSPM